MLWRTLWTAMHQIIRLQNHRTIPRIYSSNVDLLIVNSVQTVIQCRPAHCKQCFDSKENWFQNSTEAGIVLNEAPILMKEPLQMISMMAQQERYIENLGRPIDTQWPLPEFDRNMVTKHSDEGLVRNQKQIMRNGAVATFCNIRQRTCLNLAQILQPGGRENLGVIH